MDGSSAATVTTHRGARWFAWTPERIRISPSCPRVTDHAQPCGHLCSDLRHHIHVVLPQPRPLPLPVPGDCGTVRWATPREPAVAAPGDRVVLGQVRRQIRPGPHPHVLADPSP